MELYEKICFVILIVMLALTTYFNIRTATNLRYITGLIKSKSQMESLDKIRQVWGFDTTINNQRMFVAYPTLKIHDSLGDKVLAKISHRTSGTDFTVYGHRGEVVTYLDPHTGKWLRVVNCGEFSAITGTMDLKVWHENKNLTVYMGTLNK